MADDRRARSETLAQAIREKKHRTERVAQADLGARGRQGGLIRFIKYFWHVLEPNTPFVDGWAIRAVCQHLEAVTRGEIRRLLINVPPGFAKALDVNTPVLTTWGWKNHGDLRAGDFVFGPDGHPRRVLAVTPHVDEMAYEVEFDEGTVIVAGEGHLWEVERDYAYGTPGGRRCRKNKVVATPELIKSIKGRDLQRPDRIAVAEPIQLPPRNLLIDPYVLGAWLGDGGSNQGVIYSGDQDVDHFKALGHISHTKPAEGAYRQAFHRITVDELRVRLRVLGLLNNKHIPVDYLQSGVDQRWELLRGLMDTDGTATKEGHCSFVTKYAHLAEQVAQLCASLGLKACRNEKYSSLNGVKYGPHYYVKFTAPTGVRIFGLERKQARLRGNLNARSRGRYVQDVRPVGSRTVNCIQVEGQLYLAGERFVCTHNSLIVNCFWPAWEWSAAAQPWHRYVTFAYAAHLTERDNARFRDVVQSHEFRELWGSDLHLIEDGKIKPSNNHKGWKFSSSIRGVGTGERGTRVLADDVHNVKEGDSEAIRSETVRWVREGMSNRLNDMQTDVIIAIGQRVHEDDASAALMDTDEYDHLMIPMEYDPSRHCETSIGWSDPRVEAGDLAWPERFPRRVVAQLKRTLGPTAYAAQYQQSPEPRGGGILKRDWWGAYELPIGAPFRHKFEFVVASLDPAFTAKQENDPSGFSVWGVYVDGGKTRIVLIHAWKKWLELHGQTMERLPNEDNRAYVRRTSAKWGLVEWVAHDCTRLRVNTLLVEAKASGHSVVQEIRRLYREQSWGIRLIDPGRLDKRARAFAVQHLFADDMIEAPASVSGDTLVYRDWAQMVIDEAAKFRGLTGDEDNLVDSLTMALSFLRDNGIAVRAEEHQAMADANATYQGQREPIYPV